MVPIDIAEHLVLGEEERLEGRDPLLPDPDFEARTLRITEDDEGVQEPVDIDLPIGHPTETGIPLQVLDLVEIEATTDEPLQGTRGVAPDQRLDPCGGIGCDPGEGRLHLVVFQETTYYRLMVARYQSLLQLLDRMREGIVPHIVQERSEGYQTPHELFDTGDEVRIDEAREGARSEVIDAEGMIETGVGRTWIDEVRQPEVREITDRKSVV